MLRLVVLYAGASVLLIGFSIPLIRQRVKPNGWYGFRIPLTMNNPDIWYPVNRYAGKRLLIIGLTLLAASIMLLWWPGITLNGYASVMAILALGGLTVVFVFGWRYARKLAR